MYYTYSNTTKLNEVRYVLWSFNRWPCMKNKLFKLSDIFYLIWQKGIMREISCRFSVLYALHFKFKIPTAVRKKKQKHPIMFLITRILHKNYSCICIPLECGLRECFWLPEFWKKHLNKRPIIPLPFQFLQPRAI